MDFFNSAVDVLQTLVIALGAGLGIWGGINLMEGYGNDNPGANAQGFLCRKNRHLIRILSSRIIKSSATYSLNNKRL